MFKKYSEDINLFLISFLILFLEIAIVRWISTEIRIFAYLNNLVLLACFLGIGLGCYFSDRKVCLSLSISMLSVLIMFVNLPFTVHIKDEFLHIFRDIPFFPAGFIIFIVLPLRFSRTLKISINCFSMFVLVRAETDDT